MRKRRIGQNAFKRARARVRRTAKWLVTGEGDIDPEHLRWLLGESGMGRRRGRGRGRRWR